MIVRRECRDAVARTAWGTALAALLCAAPGARAGEHVAEPLRWSVAALSGSSMPDLALSDYQWTVRPRSAWGAEAFAGRGALAAGVRLWNTWTTQESALPSGTLRSTVRLSSIEAVARTRLVRAFGLDIAGAVSAGGLRIAWDPEQIDLDVSGTPVEVRFAPVHEWIAGAGLSLTRPLAGPWRAGIEAERRFFRMDTAHRNGSTIEYRRDTFGDWSARAALAWQSGPR